MIGLIVILHLTLYPICVINKKSKESSTSNIHNKISPMKRNITDECEVGCAIIRNLESKERLRQVMCSYLDSTSSSYQTLYFCGNRNHVYSYYEGQQRTFLRSVNYHGNLNFSGPVYFIVEDNATLSYNTEIELMNAGYPFLSHAHLIDKQNIDKPKPYIFQPDYHFIQHNGYKALLENFGKKCIPFPSRKKNVFWRGSTTGIPSNQSCEGLLRYQICEISKSKGWLDVRLSKKVQWCQDSTIDLSTQMTELYWVSNRGILDVDGNVNAWGLYWRLASGSVVFKVESDFTNAYIDRLIPWVHYVPILRNLSDLVERTKMIVNERQTKHLARIAKSSKILMRQFTFESEVSRVVHELNKFQDQHKSSIHSQK